MSNLYISEYRLSDSLKKYNIIKYPPEFSDAFGPFRRAEIAALLEAIVDMQQKVYPVPAIGSTEEYKIDSRGRYGAFRFTIQQLVDAAALDKAIIPWAAQKLSPHGDGPYDSKRRTSWADEAIKKYGPKGDNTLEFSSPRTEERNNIQYYLLTNPIPPEIAVDKLLRFSNAENPIRGFFDATSGGTLGPDEWQIVFAYKYLEFTYGLLKQARAITDTTQPETIAGLLAVAMCESLDAAVNYAHNTIKTNTDGVSARVWYEGGWNAVATEKKNTIEEPIPVPDPATTAVTNVKSTATSETPQPDTASAPASTTTDSGNPDATPEKSDTPPPPATDSQVAAAQEAKGETTTPPEKYNTLSISQDTYTIQYDVSGNQGAKGSYSGKVLLNKNGYVLAVAGPTENRIALQSTLLGQLDSKERTYQNSLNTITDGVAASNPLSIFEDRGELRYEWTGTSGIISVLWQDVKISGGTISSLGDLKSIQTISDQVNSYIESITDADAKSSIQALLGKISLSVLETVKKLYELDQSSALTNEILDAIASAKSDVANTFIEDTEPMENWRNIPQVPSSQETTTGSAGDVTSTSSQTFKDGSTTKTTITQDADGMLSKQVEVQPAPPPVNTAKSAPLEKDDAVPHPEKDASVAEGPNSLAQGTATSRPQNISNYNSENSNKGFRDPNRVYPTPGHQNKPDTNPLATGVNSSHIRPNPASTAGDSSEMSRGASPAARNATRKRDVKMAGRNGTSWSQPESPYAARYPYNKVFGSESGHALELDDTPGAERLNWAHRSGTFDEIGPDGTKVTKIVGDGYTIYDKDGYIMIEGQANVHVAGACNVFIAGDTNLTMHGKASIDIHNDLDLNVGGHIAVTAGKGIFVRNQGIFSLDNVGDIEMRGKGNMTQEVVGTYNITTTAGYNMSSKADSHVKVLGVTYTTSKGDMNFCTDAIFKAKAAGDINLKTAAVMKQESASDFNIKSGGILNEESAGATNVKSGAAVNVDGAGNISLRAPEVASSKFSAPTIDVTTLRAATTNLKGTHNTPDDTTNIKGSAGPVSPASANPAVAAVEADCAQVAPLSNPVPLELPVSVSKGASRNRSLADSGNSGTGANGNTGGGGAGGTNAPETTGMANDGTPAESRDEYCQGTENGSTENPVDGSPSSPGGDQATGPYSPAPNGAYNRSPSGRTYAIPLMTSANVPMNLRLSDNYTVYHLTRSSYFHGFRSIPNICAIDDIVKNMQAVANLVLEPLRRQYPGFTITSAYRTYGHAPSNGARLSAHMTGAAVDLQWPNRSQQLSIASWIARNISTDQVLYEAQSWVHVGLYGVNKNRTQRRQFAETDRNGRFTRTHNRGV